MGFDLAVLTSPKETDTRFAIVEHPQIIEAAELLRQVGGSSTSLALDIKQAADKRADAVIAQTTGACALAAFAPTVSFILETGIGVTGIIRIARIYGVSLTRQEASKFLKEMLFALGAWQAMAIIGEKVFTSAVETTGVGAVGAMAIDSVITAAEAVAACTAAKLYFGSSMNKGDLRRLVRASFRQARKQLRNKEELTKLAKTARAAAPSYDYMSQIMQSRFGRDILGRLALTTPVLAKDLADYLQTADMSEEAFTPAALKKLDKETGLVKDLWSLAQSYVDTDKLVRLSAEADSTFALLDTLAALPGGDEAVALMPETSAHLFDFPPGHPLPNVLYARHPLAPDILYPFAQFHRLTFEHKVCEALALLASLGARQLSVRHVEGMSEDIAVSVAASLSEATTPPATAGQSIFVGARSSNSSEILFEATYQGHAPTMPSGLIWYKHEPTWQHVAEARLHQGLTSFNLHVRYTDSFGVNARLAAKLSLPAGLGPGINLGGTFHDFEVTDWCISGVFDDPEPKAVEPSEA
jgi:uncharacterized protein (DUF697 family)